MTRDTWTGEAKRPLSFNKWEYVEDNVINRVDPSGHSPDCGQFEYADLTQWLMDELNADKDSWVIQSIKTYMNMSKVNQEVPHYPTYDHSSSVDPAIYGYLIFADAVKSGGLWDFKLKINDYVGANIRISDKWYFYDVSGNITFGYLGLAAGISERDLHCGADWANDWKNDKSVWGYCSGQDPKEDYDAIEAGFDLWKSTQGRMISLPDLTTAFQRHPMHAGKYALPNPQSIKYWPYTAGTFDGTKSMLVPR